MVDEILGDGETPKSLPIDLTMAGTEEAPPRGSLEFLDSAVLDTIIPFATELDIEDALKGSVERIDGGKTSPLAAIPQRHAVYLGKSSP